MWRAATAVAQRHSVVQLAAILLLILFFRDHSNHPAAADSCAPLLIQGGDLYGRLSRPKLDRLSCVLENERTRRPLQRRLVAQASRARLRAALWETIAAG